VSSCLCGKNLNTKTQRNLFQTTTNNFMKTKMKLSIIIITIAVSFLNWNCTSSNNQEMKTDEHAEHKTNEYYTCPMHPSVRSDKPGACPVCGMALVKKTIEETEASSQNSEVNKSLGAVTLSPSKQMLASVSTTVAKKMKLQKEIRAVGKIDYAEPNFRHISARFSGRLEKLYLTFTGQKVQQGDAVAEVYSPEIISAQREFLLAQNSFEEIQQSGIDLSDAQTLLEQAKQKLLRFGFTDEQIFELHETKQPKDVVKIFSQINGTVMKKNVNVQQYVNEGETMYDVADLSVVWMNADVYESEMQLIRLGQEVEATSETYPNEKFDGKIIFISPTIDASSRTVRVRVEFPNQNEKLKLEMFVNAKIKIDLDESVVVPQSAIISAGNRKVVWIQKSEKVFEPRNVTLGASAENYVQILSGVEKGETVVTSGGYLLDSESQLQMGMGTSEHAQHENNNNSH